MEICAMCGRYTGENNDHVCSECRNSVQHVPFLDLESKVQETLKREEEQEKQIKEMAREIGDVWLVSLDGDVKCLDEVLWNDDILSIAIELHNIGYRKERQGEWIEHIEKPSWLEDDVEVYYNCSVCGTSHWSITPPYCPNCGAKMKGAE